MDRIEIIQRAKKISSLESLLLLINDLKFEELGNDIKPFTVSQLRYFSNPNFTTNRYQIIKIPKKSGGKRKVYSPCPTLKMLQHYVNIILTTLYIPNEKSFGFVLGKSIVDNASVHTGKNYVFNIDLSDFFTTITQARICKRLQLRPFNFNKSVALVLSGIASIKIFASNFTGLYSTSIRLPQGAPSSPTIANSICDLLDIRLERLAQSFGLDYSRYADDITFSSNHNVYQSNSEFISLLHKIITDEGFTINASKTRLQKNCERQLVTGIVVNNKTNIKRERIRSLRQILYIWSKYGKKDADKRFKMFFKKHLKVGKKETPDLINFIRGNLEFVKMVKGENSPQFKKLNSDFQELCILWKRESKLTSHYVTFLKTWHFTTYENNHSEIFFSKTNNRSAYYLVKGKAVLMSVSKKIRSYNKNNLLISLCQRRDGSRFFLIHNQ